MDKNIRFKKLLLFAMQMNTAKNVKFRITIDKVVNLKLFKDVRLFLFLNYYFESNNIFSQSSIHTLMCYLGKYFTVIFLKMLLFYSIYFTISSQKKV